MPGSALAPLPLSLRGAPDELAGAAQVRSNVHLEYACVECVHDGGGLILASCGDTTQSPPGLLLRVGHDDIMPHAYAYGHAYGVGVKWASMEHATEALTREN